MNVVCMYVCLCSCYGGSSNGTNICSGVSGEISGG